MCLYYTSIPEDTPDIDAHFYNILSSWWRLIHHLCLLFLESLSDSFTSCHELLYASSNAAGLALDQGFGGEVVNAGVEAVGDKVGEHL
jgi:hypothetical protein